MKYLISFHNEAREIPVVSWAEARRVVNRRIAATMGARVVKGRVKDSDGWVIAEFWGGERHPARFHRTDTF